MEPKIKTSLTYEHTLGWLNCKNNGMSMTNRKNSYNFFKFPFCQ